VLLVASKWCLLFKLLVCLVARAQLKGAGHVLGYVVMLAGWRAGVEDWCGLSLQGLEAG
jgi:hypothetical protein